MNVEKLKELLNNLLKQMNNIEMIAIVDKDGLPISSLMIAEDEEVMGAVSASFETFIERIKKEFKGTNFQNITSYGDKKFFFISAGEEAILTMVGNQNSNDNEMKVFGEFAGLKIARIFQEEEDVSIEIPMIVKTMSKFQDGKFPSGQFSAKLIVCGSYGVGKTSIIRRYVDDAFKKNYIATIGVDISKKKISLDENCTVNFLIWDIGGQIHQMAPYRKRFYSGADAAFIVIDKTRKDSFKDSPQSFEMWLKDISSEIIENIPMVLVANKNDLVDEFEVTTQEIESFAKELNIEFIETSAKTGENVYEAFKFTAFKIIEKI